MAKRMILIALAIMLVFACVGCRMVTVNEERDGERVVATVNGVDITKAEVASQLKLYLSYMGLEPGSAEYEQYYASMIEEYMEASIIMELCLQKCEEYGIEAITAEQQQTIEEELQATADFAESLAETNVLEDDYDTKEQYEAAREAYIKNYLDETGYNSGSQKETLERAAVTDNLIAYLVKDYDPSEEEIKAYYEQELADQQQVIDEQLSSFVNFESDVLLYTPEGINYIKYVFVELDEEAQDEITAATSDEVDAVREEKLKTIEATAKEALEAAKEDFDAAIKEYSPEGDSIHAEGAMKNGLRIYKGTTNYPTEVADAAEALENAGDISDLIATNKGYYIVQLVSEVEAGVAAFEDVKDELKEMMIEEEKDSVFTVKTGEWLDEAEIKYYRNRF